MYGLLTVKFQTNSFQSSAASATRSLGKLVKLNKMVGPLDLNIDIGSQDSDSKTIREKCTLLSNP